ncbi:LEAF RUST 10 DISEASE-RESISTANCE LOCUS RECEPTOR-LIKE PROTEIN KINASE-like 2.4 [Tripterygium wilfordii]|uniref:LEAF RUST 10 DISEASE-RESISTANCE LOCUS RECEPTOR-LIKE PROTEIN KINASE-like 2.4 n=1 Tax=Tripterygium wilfordii TaxID=458696 RepID=UPI0018F8540C|nr:LEAF RUST 10 DISEASE-RESISTANCE LOCUS RECEPTOR-LIKE PROTEIN KINASE-like 2.4 [Tripterygium wilfordii]
MLKNKLLFAVLISFLALHFHVSHGENNQSMTYNCDHHSSCGDNIKIGHPFRLKGDPPTCGDPNYELSCDNNHTILSFNSAKYVVKAIDYNNFTIRVADIGIQEHNCSSTPLRPLRPTYQFAGYYDQYFSSYHYFANVSNIDNIVYISCETPTKSHSFVDAAPCISKTSYSNRRYHYVMAGDVEILDLDPSCAADLITTTTLLREKNKRNISYMDIHRELVYGLELSWATMRCGPCHGIPGTAFCTMHNTTLIVACPIKSILEEFLRALLRALPFLILQIGIYVCLALLARALCGIPCLLALVGYKWRRRHLSMDDSLEEFLQSQKNLMPIRYSYSHIKKMSKGFQEKLGEGGYGTVFKGKLRSGQLVAIKMLGKSKANGQDFINEVATIGRIHHVNVVRLIGFCAEGPKRALVYEFMPKGSLDKYILSQEGGISLSSTKMYEISVGVARGIEYLHRGCDIQILHFDIKPHNVLLDENFVPKISDFGLAKLYSTDDSIVSVTAARGTIGYIAPELIFKRIGGVSYKADVYSFGMLLMEMLGKRKKLDAETDNNSSRMYFPLWVYHEMVEGKVTEVGDATNEEENIIKKMTLVGLWCIQIRPCDRPPMRKAIQMLEGHIENLTLPPEPTFNIEQVPAEEVEEATNPTWSSLTSISTSESVRLVIDAD